VSIKEERERERETYNITSRPRQHNSIVRPNTILLWICSQNLQQHHQTHTQSYKLKENDEEIELSGKRNINSKLIRTLKATLLSDLLDNCKEHDICFLNSTVSQNQRMKEN
jgi:hypothetical protein